MELGWSMQKGDHLRFAIFAHGHEGSMDYLPYIFRTHSRLLRDYYDHYVKESFSGHFIRRVLQIAGVGTTTQLEGKRIHVCLKRPGYVEIAAIGSIEEDDWFDPSEEFKKHIRRQIWSTIKILAGWGKIRKLGKRQTASTSRRRA